MLFFNKQKSLYIIGDVHGCAKTLQALINQLPHKEKSHIIFVGDLIDRGKYSAQVIEFVRNNGYACIRGNHEQYMLDAHRNPNKDVLYCSMGKWKNNGGEHTAQSYIGRYKALLESDLDWIESLPSYLEYDIPDESGRTLFITHGFGLPYWKNKEDPELELLFQINRLTNVDSTEFNFSEKKENYKNTTVFNVFGHDVQKTPLITTTYAAIDTGCFFGSFPKTEQAWCLSALEWPSKKIYTQPYIG